MRNKNLALTLALALTIPLYGTAAAAPKPSPDDFVHTETIQYNGRDFATIHTVKPHSFSEADFKSQYDLTDGQYAFIYNGVKDGLDYWSRLLAPNAKNNIPWQIILSTNDENNASALPLATLDGNDTDRNLVAENIQLGTPLLEPITAETILGNSTDEDEEDKVTSGLSSIELGQYMGAGSESDYGWHRDKATLLPSNEEKADLVGTIRHELGHALGIVVNTDIINTESQEVITDDSNAEELLQSGKILFTDNNNNYFLSQRFTTSDISPDSWNSHLVDQNGNPAASGMRIVTRQIFEQLNAEHNLKQSDFFIVDDIGATSTDSGNKATGFAYFVGAHVKEALDGATFYGMNGLPVNAWEYGATVSGSDKTYKKFEGSHLNTPGLMSHRPYSNYTTFMEVELAAMQDLGYSLDRKAFYGRSVYDNNKTLINEQGYSARNKDGTAYLPDQYSEVPLGIGLHVFGSKNTITQKGDILTQGIGAAGMRIDGIENKLTIAPNTQIHADGERGIGILTAYGRDHVFDIQGTVTALGPGGNAMLLDFGSSSNGALDEYRGSYIRYTRLLSTNKQVNDKDKDEDDETTAKKAGQIEIFMNKHLAIDDKNEINALWNEETRSSDELEGALAKEITISGTLAGSENAILISKNAFVEKINIADGAQLSGNITSNWKHFTTADGSDDPNYNPDPENFWQRKLKIQHPANSDGYDWQDYVPELVTQLNFTGDISYDGNINGNDNMKMNIQSGTLSYGGTADVVSVTVDENATLLGGNYILNNMEERLAPGCTDDTTGQFIVKEKAAIGAASADSNMNINGELILKEGATLIGYAGSEADKGIIKHESSSQAYIYYPELNIKLFNALPNEEKVILQSNTNVSGYSSTTVQQSPLLEISSSTGADGKSIVGKASLSDHLGSRTPEQSEALSSITRMANTYQGSKEADILRPLFNMPSADGVKYTLDRISGNSTAATNIRLAQQNTLVHDTLGSHLDQLALHADERSADEKLWLKLGKNWGDLHSPHSHTADYHGSSITAGYDWDSSPYRTNGVFLAYNKATLADEGDQAKLHDTRAGYYGSSRKGVGSLYYYGDLGYARTRTKRQLLPGITAAGKPESYLAEIGGEYQYDLHHDDNKTWHVAPYAGLTASVLRQKAYMESGAGILSQNVAEQWNTYVSAQGGVEFARALHKGSYGMRLGVLQSLAGAAPNFAVSYVGDSSIHNISTRQDRTQLALSLKADAELAPGWYIDAEAGLHRGAHEKDVTAALQLKRTW